MFWEPWDAGSIPSLVQWIKDLALPQSWLRSELWLRSDPWPRNSICHGVTKKGRKEKKKGTIIEWRAHRIPNEAERWDAFWGDTIQPTTKIIWVLWGRGSWGQGCCGLRPDNLGFTPMSGFKVHPCHLGSSKNSVIHMQGPEGSRGREPAPHPSAMAGGTTGGDSVTWPELDQRQGFLGQQHQAGGTLWWGREPWR